MPKALSVVQNKILDQFAKYQAYGSRDFMVLFNSGAVVFIREPKGWLFFDAPMAYALWVAETLETDLRAGVGEVSALVRVDYTTAITQIVKELKY